MRGGDVFFFFQQYNSLVAACLAALVGLSLVEVDVKRTGDEEHQEGEETGTQGHEEGSSYLGGNVSGASAYKGDNQRNN